MTDCNSNQAIKPVIPEAAIIYSYAPPLKCSIANIRTTTTAVANNAV